MVAKGGDDVPQEKKMITVAGVTFGAEQVKEAVVEIDGREVYIKRPPEKKEPVVTPHGYKEGTP